MTTIRYCDLIKDPAAAVVTGMGFNLGPPGGDGWEIVARLPAARIPSSGRYAFIVSGKIGGISLLGATPRNGVAQVCLGDTSGLRHPLYRTNIPLGESLGALESVPFQFVVLFSASPVITDVLWGSTWNNTGGFEMCLWARVFLNNDPATYSASFVVSDVSWLWFDVDRIPVGDRQCEEVLYSPPLAITTSLAGIAGCINTPGSAGQKWLHFVNLSYTPRASLGPAPSFTAGFSTGASFAGFTGRVGTNGRLGMARWPAQAGPEPLIWHQGAFWYEQQPGAVYLPGIKGFDRQTFGAGASTLVYRFRYFGVRLDNLLDVLVRSDTQDPNVTGNLTIPPPWQNGYVPLERPATAIVSAPFVFSTGIVQSTDRRAYDAALTTDRGQQLAFPTQFTQTDAALAEGQAVMAFSDHGLSRSEPDIQYRAHFLGGLSGSPIPFAVRDVTIVQFTPVRDPDVLPNAQPSVGAPVIVVPGRESLDPGSLSAPPTAPCGIIAESGDVAESALIGATGYKRTWPIGGKVRRAFTIQWPVLGESAARTLFDFLVAHPAFRFTPPRRAAIAVLQIDNPQMQQEQGAQVYSISTRVTELIWTGT